MRASMPVHMSTQDSARDVKGVSVALKGSRRSDYQASTYLPNPAVLDGHVQSKLAEGFF